MAESSREKKRAVKRRREQQRVEKGEYRNKMAENTESDTDSDNSIMEERKKAAASVCLLPPGIEECARVCDIALEG